MVKSNLLAKLLLSLGSAAFVLFLIEFPAWIQVLDYRTLIGPSHVWWAPNIMDPELLIIHRPRAHQSGSSRGGDAALAYQVPSSDLTFFRWDVRYDHNGFRNKTDLKSAEIAVIGDSFVEGLTVSYEQLATSLLANLQGKVVANLGQSTYGPQQELVVLKRYGLPLQPRTVVWMFFEGNDLEDVIAFREAVLHPPNAWRAFVKRSCTRNAVKGVEWFLFRPVKARGVEHSGIVKTADRKDVRVYFLYSPKPFTGDNLGALDETARTIAVAYQLCSFQGARLLFVFVPEKFRVFHDFCRFPEESKCRTWVPNDLPERLRRLVGSAAPQVGFLDLTPELAKAVKMGALPYYPDDEHWSPEGHRIAATAINAYLVSAYGR
jgi:hypothetical protein